MRRRRVGQLPRSRGLELLEEVEHVGDRRDLAQLGGVEVQLVADLVLDFSELALRVEDEIGDELNFDAPELRQIATISDVLDFLEQLQAA